jgi:PAS domain S-box-containing protein
MTYETRYRASDGRIFPVEITCTLFEYNGVDYNLSLVRDISERKRAEEEVCATMNYLENIINAIANPVFVKDAEHRYVLINDACCNMTGRTREEILGKTTYDLFPHVQSEIFTRIDNQVLENGESNVNEEEITDTAGCSKTVITHKSRYVDPHGNRFIVGVIRDISERINMEKQLREHDRLLSTLLDNFPDFIARFDTEGRHIFVNQAVGRAFGIPFEEFVGKNLPSLAFVKGENNQRLHEAILQVVADGEGNSLETMWELPNGCRYFEIRHIPEKDEHGKVVSVLGIARDISEKKHIEIELKASEACYRQSSNLLKSILESSPTVGVYALDREYRYLAFNQRHWRGMNYLWGGDIAIGTSLLDAVASDEYREKIRNVFDEVLSGQSISAEAKFKIVKDGGEVIDYIENYGSPIFNDDGVVVGLTFFTINVTERKQIQEQLLHSEQQYRTLAENTPGIIVRYDRDCCRLYVNPAFTRETGINAEAALGSSLEDSWMNDSNVSAKEYSEVLRRVMATGVPEEILLEWPNRETGYLSCHLFHVAAEKNGDGSISGCLAVGHDITRLRDTELKLAKLAEISPGILANLRMKPDGAFCMSYASHRIGEIFGLSPERLANDMSEAFGRIHPDDRQGHVESIRESAHTLSPWHHEFRIAHPDKGEIWVEGNGIPERQPDGGVLWYGFLHDITGRKRLELVNMARLHLLQFATTHTLDELLEAILDEAETLTESRIGFYVFLLDDQRTLSLQNWSARTKRDYCKAEGKGLHYDVSQAGVWVDCVHQRRPVVHNDYASLPHRKGLPTDHAPLVRELVVPVFRGEHIVAIIAMGNKPTDYTSRDVETVSLLADLTWDIADCKRGEEALLAKRAQLAVLNNELSLAEERERQNIATTLHDHIGQTLLLGRIKLGSLAKEQMPEPQKKIVMETKELIDQVTHDIHNLTVQINPPILATAGLEAALKWLGRKMEEDYGLFVEFDDDLEEKPLLDEIRSVVYQCARELLINVAKHADTHWARLAVGREEGRFRLTVEDDGVGFNFASLLPDSSRDCRFGLFSIQIRMERIGGSVVFDSALGQGSRMTLLAPLALDRLMRKKT